MSQERRRRERREGKRLKSLRFAEVVFCNPGFPDHFSDKNGKNNAFSRVMEHLQPWELDILTFVMMIACMTDTFVHCLDHS